MRNPGLNAFAAGTTYAEKPATHPIWDDVRPGDVDYDPEHEEDPSDYVPPVDFGRWRNPGQSIRVPLHRGPTFKPGDTPEDVIHGEVISPAEQESADKILSGEHESDSPSENPFVEHARQDLHTPGASGAVETLSGLLRGGSPHDVGDTDEAHDYLSRHFTGVRVNPHHGTLLAQSPAGMQLVRRHASTVAVPETPSVLTYSLTNKHGTFHSDDPKRLVRAMVAFQIVHNEIAQQQQQKKKKDEDQDDDNGLSSTSASAEWLKSLFPTVPPPKPKMPESAVFEPGKGLDEHDNGQVGGWVAPEKDAPADWHRDGHGTAYSPGHHMRLMLDPKQAVQPIPDPRFPGHTFTYASNPENGHTVPRRVRGVNYFVQDKIHPAARGGGFDLIDVPRSWSTEPRKPRRGPKTPPPKNLPQSTSAVQENDLCPVCVSGYLENYDGEHHECLNCGSLVKQAAPRRKPGGLGRGLKDMAPYEGDPLNLGSGGSENPEFEAPEGSFVHPLSGEENQSEEEGYEAPKRILDKKAGETDPIDEHMGKLNFFPVHKPGHERAYIKPMEDIEGSYWRLTEGAPHPKTGQRGWSLTADHIPPAEQWEVEGQPYRGKSVSLPVNSINMDDKRYRRQNLPDLANRIMGEKSFLASGSHPIDDDTLNRAIRDVHLNGRNSETYQNAVLGTAYEPPRPTQPNPKATQRDLRQLSSVGNPGLSRFVS